MTTLLGVASFWPYITVFAKQLGISETSVGYIFTVAPILGIIVMPLFGSIADRFKIKKKLFLVFNLINLVAILCFAILNTAETRVHRPVEIECGVGASFVKHCHRSNDDGWNSSVVTAKVLKELGTKHYPIACQIDCQSNQTEVDALCSALFNPDYGLPSICTKNSTLSEEIHISFMSTLKFQTIMPLESCLYVQIDQITEMDENMGSRGLSCAPKQVLNHCHINCPDLSTANSAMVDIDSKEDEEDAFTRRFWLYAFFTILGWIAMAVVTSVADALCFQTLGKCYQQGFPSE